MNKTSTLFILPFLLIAGCTATNSTDLQSSTAPTGEGRAHNHADHQHDHPSAAASEKKAEKPAASQSITAAKPYPLSTCVVSDEPLGSMGDTIVEVYQGQTIKFCCKGCIKDFHADPDRYLAKL